MNIDTSKIRTYLKVDPNTKQPNKVKLTESEASTLNYALRLNKSLIRYEEAKR